MCKYKLHTTQYVKFISSYSQEQIVMNMGTTATAQTSWILPDILVEKYSDDLLMGILDAVHPSFSAIPYVRKKHQTHRFRALLRLKQILEEKRGRILNRVIEVLPKEANRMYYLKAQGEILKIFNEELKDVMKEINELVKIINKNELKASLKTDIRRQIGILNSMRDSILEIASDDDIPDEDFEKYLALDQGISLLIKLYQKMLENWEDVELSLYILMLNLRILAILNGREEHIKLLKKDIVEMAPKLEKTASPEELEEILKLVGEECPTSSTQTSS